MNKAYFSKKNLFITLFFLVTFVYNILRPIKASFILGIPNAGDDLIPLLKIFVVMPGAFLFVYLYSYLIHGVNREYANYIIFNLFVSFFIIFGLFLYPYSEQLQLQSLALYLHENLGVSASLCKLIQYWMFSLFYGFAELFGSMVLSTIVWGLANEYNSMSDAKKNYGAFLVAINASGIITAIIGNLVSDFSKRTSFFPNISCWDKNVLIIMSIQFLACLLSVINFAFLIKLLKQEKCALVNFESKAKKKSSKSFKLKDLLFLFKSKHLVCISLLLLCYNLTYNLSDVMWHASVKQYYLSDKMLMTKLFNNAVLAQALIATTMSLLARLVLNRVGWRITALITPSIFLITGFGFYGLMSMYYIFNDFQNLFGCDVFYLVVILGSVHVCCIRGFKYTLFDATKEMSYLSLEPDTKAKGKAVIDGLISRLGKSGGSMLYAFLLTPIFGSVIGSILFVGPFVFCLSILWLAVIIMLARIMANKKTISNKGLSEKNDEVICEALVN